MSKQTDAETKIQNTPTVPLEVTRLLPNGQKSTTVQETKQEHKSISQAEETVAVKTSASVAKTPPPMTPTPVA
jgi:hypothetical protein